MTIPCTKALLIFHRNSQESILKIKIEFGKRRNRFSSWC